MNPKFLFFIHVLSSLVMSWFVVNACLGVYHQKFAGYIMGIGKDINLIGYSAVIANIASLLFAAALIFILHKVGWFDFTAFIVLVVVWVAHIALGRFPTNFS